MPALGCIRTTHPRWPYYYGSKNEHKRYLVKVDVGNGLLNNKIKTTEPDTRQRWIVSVSRTSTSGGKTVDELTEPSSFAFISHT